MEGHGHLENARRENLALNELRIGTIRHWKLP
jgi:hypothetical protein